jgi:hypothetical protein
MEEWLKFAKGPLFGFTFLVMVLGLARFVVIQAYSIARGKGRRFLDVAWRGIITEGASWAFPAILDPRDEALLQGLLSLSHRCSRRALVPGRSHRPMGKVSGH